MTDPDYQPINRKRYRACIKAFEALPQENGRFSGSPEETVLAADLVRDLFRAPGAKPLYMKQEDANKLADYLQNEAQSRWSIGQYTSALASLVDSQRY